MILTDLYLSLSSYITLGMGDIVPRGCASAYRWIRSAAWIDADRVECVLHLSMIERLWRFGPEYGQANAGQAGISSDRSE